MLPVDILGFQKIELLDNFAKVWVWPDFKWQKAVIVVTGNAKIVASQAPLDF